MLRSKWPNFLRAFDNFEVDRVAAYGEAGVDRLLGDAGIVRNGKKVTGTIENARAMHEIAEAGGMTAWLRGYGADAGALIATVRKRFHHMGEVTSRMFLTAVGAIEYQTWQPTVRQRRGVA